MAEARSGVSRDRYTQAVEYLPEAEGPARLVKQLFTLGCGIGIIEGKQDIDDGAYGILKKVAEDTLPSHRNLILKTMWQKEIFGGTWQTTRELSGTLNQPVTTVKLNLENMMLLRLVNRKMDGVAFDQEDTSYRKGETTPYHWQLSEKSCELMRDSEIYRSHDDNGECDPCWDEGAEEGP